MKTLTILVMLALAIMSLPASAGEAVEAKSSGVVTADFRMEPGKVLFVQVADDFGKLPKGTRVTAALNATTAAEKQRAISAFAVLGVPTSSAPVVSTCVTSVTMPDGTLFVAPNGACLGWVEQGRDVRFSAGDPMTVLAGAEAIVVLNEAGAAKVAPGANP